MAALNTTLISETDSSTSRLREQIEDLAVQVVLGDTAGDAAAASWAAALSQIRDVALQQGCTESAAVAARLISGLAIDPSSSSLTKGIEELQTAFDGESQAATAAPEQKSSVANPLAEDPELLSDFTVEAREHLTSIEKQSLVLEQDPTCSDAIHSVFRSFHTIKGLAGFLELKSIHELAHQVETVLDLARNAKLTVTPAVIDLVLESADFLDQSVSVIEARLRHATPPPVPQNHALLTRITALLEAPDQDIESALFFAPAPSEPIILDEAPVEGIEATEVPEAVESTEVAVPSAPAPAATSAPVEEKEVRANTKQAESAALVSVRVDAAKLDYLMDMVGEMVIAQSLLHHEPAFTAVQNPRIQRNLSQLARATSEVQRTAMAMRMVPIGHLFQRMARVVRDLARKTGKLVNFETTGEETELDKTIAEELSDPLMHMVRNSLDHGIEDPATRQAAGKNVTGSLKLSAYHQSGQIVVEITDDGRGLDREKILAKARQKGLCEEGAHPSDTEVFNMIFAPGFSTAEQVTDVSGRGVGMDVVRKHVQKLRGRIDIESSSGRGARFLIKLPLTLAIIDGLVVGVGQYRYIVPIFAVKEMFHPTAGQVFTIEGQDEMVQVRGRLLPIVRLHRRFGVQPRTEIATDALLVVAEAEGKQFCLMVDELIGKQEVVIKSLGEMLKNIPGVAGGAILGDGRIGLILDMAGVFSGAGSAE